MTIEFVDLPMKFSHGGSFHSYGKLPDLQRVAMADLIGAWLSRPGKHRKNDGKIHHHHAIHGKIHELSMMIFQFVMLNYQRVSPNLSALQVFLYSHPQKRWNVGLVMTLWKTPAAVPMNHKKPTWLVASPFCVSWMPALLLVSSIYLCLSCPVCMTTTPFCYWKQYRYMLVIHVIPLSVCGGYGSCIAIPMKRLLFLVALVVVPPCFFSWRYFTLSYPTQLLGRTPFVIWVCLKIRSPDFDGVSWVSL